MLANRSNPGLTLRMPALLLVPLLAAGCVPSPRPTPAPLPRAAPAPLPRAAPATPPRAVPVTPPPLAAPVPAAPPAAAAIPRPSLSASLPPPVDWRDAAQTPGVWKWGMDGESSVARFGQDGDVPQVTLTCSPLDRTVTLRLARAPAVPPAGTAITVTTTGTRRMLSAKAEAGGVNAVAVPPTDPILGEMAFSRGRFMLELPGMAPLYLPVWSEIGRVIDDCR